MYRGVNDFKKDYQPRTNTVQDEKGDLITSSHSTFPRWRNHFSQLLYVLEVSHVKQTEIHTAELLVPEPSAFEMATEKLKRHRSPVIDQNPAEMIKVGGRTIRFEIHKLINFIWNKVDLPEERRSRSKNRL